MTYSVARVVKKITNTSYRRIHMAELFLSKGSMEIIIDTLHIVLSAPAFATETDGTRNFNLILILILFQVLDRYRD